MSIYGMPAASASPDVVDAPATTQSGCGPKTISVNGGEAVLDIQCHGSYTDIIGSVKDTDTDGRCAQVRAQSLNGGAYKYSDQACPLGEVEGVNLRVSGGAGANVWLLVS